jgi:hypothetical protein
MLWWVVDNAILFYLLLGLVGLALAAGWWMTRDRRYLIGLAVVFGLALLVWLLTRLIITDRQQLRHIIEEMAEAVGDRKPEVIVKHLSRDFDYYGLTRATMAQHVANAIRDYDLRYVGVWEFDIEKLSRAEGKATVAFRAKVDLGENRSQWVCRGFFVLEDGQWRMKGFNIYNPVVNTDQPIQIPLR